MNSTAPPLPHKPRGAGPMTVVVRPKDGPATTLVCVAVPPEPSTPGRVDITGYAVRSKPREPFRETVTSGTLADAVVVLTELGYERYDLFALAVLPEAGPHAAVEARWHRGAQVWEPWQTATARPRKTKDVTPREAADALALCAETMEHAAAAAVTDDHDNIDTRVLTTRAAEARRLAAAIRDAEGVTS